MGSANLLITFVSCLWLLYNFPFIHFLAAAVDESIESDPNFGKVSDSIIGNDKLNGETSSTASQSTSSELSYDESRQRLLLLSEKMDNDHSGKVSRDELRNWVNYAQARYVREDADKHFAMHDKNEDGMVEWEEYKQNTFGFFKEEDLQAENSEVSFLYLFYRDKRRWSRADQNKDGFCTKEEFRAFVHPEEFEHSKDLFVKETLEDLDKNQDGYVDLNEYIGELVKNSKSEPEWVKSTRSDFTEKKDLDGDGKLNETEVSAWIWPNNFSQTRAETNHLMYMADDDRDGELSKDEIIGHHDIFVGSLATEWGKMLMHLDDEL